MQPTVVLTPEQIEFFHREGYLVLDAITTQEEVERLREIYDQLFEQRVGREIGHQFDLAGPDEDGKEERLPQILGISSYAPELRNSLYHVNARAIACQLLGPGAEFQGEHAIRKPPGGPATPWHQDEAYLDSDKDHPVVSFWMPLQEATLENGCMYFIPGSHRWEVQPHHPINHDPRVHGLEMDEVDDSLAVACPIPAGGATIHTLRTAHYTPPNRSASPRRAYTVNYGFPSKPRAEGDRDFYWNRLKQTAREARARQAHES